ncbi:uncharacterized protein LOC105688124 [Athalia rosae]|uniref:uncharacterized protein LOC105688124 n=1 Tax=Athalia rosae TaxID=37344 RepID=UPI00203469E4|nr:uncharacterized protein LOC105688124 [Athalia rosae]
MDAKFARATQTRTTTPPAITFEGTQRFAPVTKSATPISSDESAAREPRFYRFESKSNRGDGLGHTVSALTAWRIRRIRRIRRHWHKTVFPRSFGIEQFQNRRVRRGCYAPVTFEHSSTTSHAGGQSDASTSVVRSRRDVRSENSGNISGRRYGSKTARVQPNGVAQNPTLKSQSDNAPETSKSIKGSEDIVGDREEKNDQDETVGSSLLDPLGLKDKVEDFMEDLGNFPNPLDALRGDGRHPGLPHYLGKADSSTKTSQVPQIEEHIVGASQQYNQYPNQYQQGANDYTLTSQNYPQTNSRQQYQQQPIVGGYRQSQGQQRPIVQPHSTIPQNPAPRPPIPLFGTSPVPQPPFGPAWTGRSNQMAYQRNSMPYQGYAASGYPNSYAQMNGQMTGAKSSMVGAPNPTIQSSNSNGPVNEQQTNGRNMNQPILGSPSPSSGGQEAIIGAPNPTSGFYGGGQDLSPFSDVVGVAQRVIGPLIQDSFTGSGGPYGYQNRNANPMTGMFNGADRYGRYGGYNGGSSPRHLGLGGLYDNGFNNLFDGGYNDWNYHNDRYDRIYGDGYEYGGDYPGYGYGHHHHNHQYSQIFK